MNTLYRLWSYRWNLWAWAHQPSFDRYFRRFLAQYKRELEARHGVKLP